jgi:pimeloyl-ACP methyl ester carboxylesterase
VPVPSPYAAALAAVAVRERRVTIDGVPAAYWEYGAEDAPVTIVAVHGFRGDHHGLEPIIAQLRGIRVISPDLPGFGESAPLDGRHDIPGYAHWLRRFADTLKLSSAVILGHSFGSIVVSAAVADGLEADRVILINPIAAPALSGPNGFLSRLTLLYYRVGRALPERLGAALLGSPVIVRFMSLVMVQTPDRNLRRWIHDQHDRYFSGYATRDSVVESFEASITSDVSVVAERLTTPTLLIAAERDPITPVAAEQRLADRMPNARLVVIPGVGHLIHYEKPREAAAAIVDYLGSGSIVESTH